MDGVELTVVPAPFYIVVIRVDHRGSGRRIVDEQTAPPSGVHPLVARPDVPIRNPQPALQKEPSGLPNSVAHASISGPRFEPIGSSQTPMCCSAKFSATPTRRARSALSSTIGVAIVMLGYRVRLALLSSSASRA